MEKIYGYKEKDIIGLAEFIGSNKNKSLTQAFNEYALINGKAQGTVRNLYYALAKKSTEDIEFCNKYLQGKPINVSKITQFGDDERDKLIDSVVLAKKQGNSIRKQILSLAKGDAKLALRYQNKYRNILKNNPELISNALGKMGVSNAKKDELIDSKPNLISDKQLEKLKNEIDTLVDKISLKLRRENDCLKKRIAILESENLRLNAMIQKTEKGREAKKFFDFVNGKEYIN